MKHMWYIFGVTVTFILISGGFATYILTRHIASPYWIYVSQVNVNDQAITLEKVSFTGSSMWYIEHKVSYKNGILSVSIYTRAPIRFPGDQDNSFTIRIPNTYDGIREVRIRGKDQSDNKVIWSRDLLDL